MATNSTAAKKSAPAGKTPVKSEILEGLAMYAFLHSPDKGNAARRIPPAYKVDLMLDTKEAQAKAKELGLNIKRPTEKHKHPFVTIKSKVTEGRTGPTVVDSKNNVVPNTVLVGNDSRIRVRFIPFTYGEGEVTAVLQAVQVLNLVPYERKAIFDEVDSGYTLSGAATSDDANSEI